MDDYDTLFAARHGRGALDPVPTFGDQTYKMSLDVPTPKAGPKLINPREQLMLTYGEMVSKQKESRGLQTTPPGSEIIGEGAAVFTDMTETILDALDKQVDTSTSYQQVEKSSPKEDKKKINLKEESQVPTQTDEFPDLFLPVRENYRISDCFHGYSDSLSADNNQMVLVELNNLSYRYEMSIYVVDRVNGTIYEKFSVGYRLIPEKATVIPQYQSTKMESGCTLAYDNTLPGITRVPTPIPESTPVTQPYHMPLTRTGIGSDIVHPISSEETRARYLEKQMKGIESVKLPTNISSLEEELIISMDLTERIDIFCRQQKEKRRRERESHKVFLGTLLQKKSTPTKEEGDVVYSQLSHHMEKTRGIA